MTKKGKKHKRSDRGSTEEENSIAKKQNMAASEVTLEDNTEDVFESSEENETSLKEIKGLLEGVQKTLLIMQTENRTMAAELTELKSSFSKQSTEISSLQSALKKAQNENVELKRSEEEKKRKYQQVPTVLDVEMGSFIPLVFGS